MEQDSKIIRTERLFMREIKEEDAEVLVKWRSNPEVYKFFLNPHKLTVYEHVLWFNNIYINEKNRIDWICYADEAPIGVFGIKRRCSKSREAEVSYLVEPKVQHKGYAYEAVKGILTWAITKWNICSVIAEVHENNYPSRNFIEKIGFYRAERKATFIVYRIDLEKNGGI